MGFAIELTLDEALAEPLRDCWRRLAKAGASTFMHQCGAKPHVTLCIYEDVDLDACKSQVARLAAKLPPVPIAFASLGLFLSDPPVVYASPVVSETLLDVHHRVNEAMSLLGGDTAEYYLPGQWVPHSTLAMDYERMRMTEVFAQCTKLKLPMSGYATELSIVGFPPIQYLHVESLRGT